MRRATTTNTSPALVISPHITFSWDYPFPTNDFVFNVRMGHSLTNVASWPVIFTTNGHSATFPIQYQFPIYLFHVTASNTWTHLESD
jgi:hypothetical protein